MGVCRAGIQPPPQIWSSLGQFNHLAGKLLGTGWLLCTRSRAPGGRDLPSHSDSGLTGAEVASPLRLGAPWGRGRVPPSEWAPRDRSCILASLRVGEGAVGSAASPPEGGWGCSPEALPPSWQARGVRWPRHSELGAGCGSGRGHRGLLRAALCGDGAEASCKAAGTRRGSWRGSWTAFSPRPLSPAPAVVSGAHD